MGHDPVLGWIFGTANILTDIITFSDFSSYKISRRPLTITPERVSLPYLIKESIDMVKNDKMNLPAAVFAQAQHFKSDVYTKRGLPVPIVSTISKDFASSLYNEHYDALCMKRDASIIAASAAVSALVNMIIGLVHGLYYSPDSDISRSLYEVKTRKILLISNSIASSSSLIYTLITQNPKNLDIGGLLITLSRLFSDIRFIAKIKQEYIEGEIFKELQSDIAELDAISEELTR